jgi:cystathionine beta-lyase
VIVVSDEIHCDLVFKPYQHIPLSMISEEVMQNTITCIAPSKTFNLAGLFTSSVIIPNKDMRDKFISVLEKIHLSPNIFGMTAAEAAYREGEEWLEELMAYLKANADHVIDYLSLNIPEVTVSPVEATYMLWLDFRRLWIPAPELNRMLIDKAGIGFVEGPTFGPGGEGFQRMNIACPRSTLDQALKQLSDFYSYFCSKSTENGK